MSAIVIDGLNEEDFRRSIENRLREGRVSAAIERLRAQIAPYAAPGGLLPERFLTVDPGDLVLGGWGMLRDAVRRHDLPGSPVTALSISFGWPGENAPGPGPDGRLKPHLETCWYTDAAWPFSLSGREDLLDGYSFYGCAWAGDCVAVDAALWLDGIDDLHGALARLETDLLACEEPDEEAVRAGSLGACLLSALLVQAVADRIAADGLPRPLCVMAGSNGVYPYFDAPVAGMSDAARKAAEDEDETAEAGFDASGARVEVPAPRYSSLLMTGIPRARKRPALVLEESEDDLNERLARLRNLAHGDEVPADETAPAALAESGIAPAEGGRSPLLAKKAPGQAWDFRDMLSPPEPEPGPEPEPEPAPAPAPAQVIPLPEPEPAAPFPVEEFPEAPVTVPVAVAAAPTAPGPAFPNLSPGLQERLDKLIAAKLEPPREEPAASAPGRIASWWRGRIASMRGLPARVRRAARMLRRDRH